MSSLRRTVGYNSQNENIFGLFFGGNPDPQPSMTRRRGGGQQSRLRCSAGFGERWQAALTR